MQAYNINVYWQKILLTSVVLNLPVFFAGIIFITTFRKTKNRHMAYGANLFGAVTGGLLESLSFVLFP